MVNNTNTNVLTQNCQGVTEKMDVLDVSEIQDLCEKLQSCSLNKFDDVEKDDEDTGLFRRFLTHLVPLYYVIIYIISY